MKRQAYQGLIAHFLTPIRGAVTMWRHRSIYLLLLPSLCLLTSCQSCHRTQAARQKYLPGPTKRRSRFAQWNLSSRLRTLTGVQAPISNARNWNHILASIDSILSLKRPLSVVCLNSVGC